MSKTIVLDNSGRQTFRTCKKKFLFQNVYGWQSDFGSTALRYGSCYHAMQEGYHKWVQENSWPTDPEASMIAMTKALKMGKECYDEDTAKKSYYEDFKNFNTCVTTFNAYLDFFKDDKKFIKIIETEQKFQCPIEPDNSEEEKLLSKLPPITFTGKIDLQVELDRTPWLLDHKTTGRYLNKVIQQANRSPQLIGYSYAGKKVLDFEPQGCLCSFAYTGSTKSRTTGQYGKIRNDFRRVPQLYTQGDIDAWKISFIDTAREIEFAEQENSYPESFDNCYQYGRCTYMNLCQQHVPYEDLDFTGFHIDKWDVLED